MGLFSAWTPNNSRFQYHSFKQYVGFSIIYIFLWSTWQNFELTALTVATATAASVLTENDGDGTEKYVTTDQLGQNNPATQTENEKAIQSDYQAMI